MAAREQRAAVPSEIPPAMLAAMKQGAVEAAHRAYAPYSRFAVGAAVLSDDGRIHTGANVENASFGLSICAERNAIFRAVADGARRIEAMVVYTPTADATPPCGACRQVLAEFGADALIVCCSDGAADRRYPLAELLPEAFGPDHL
ncbi:MAG TPA: cytidine deaminase [Casimicrobiaceae bacterium]|nr:cytidine deaminase [Casimicrobiaceae bacterium]